MRVMETRLPEGGEASTCCDTEEPSGHSAPAERVGHGHVPVSPLSWGIQKVPNPQTQTVEGWERGWGGERGLGV